ncbi:MAG: class I SAM-dependent methyltransferase [Bacteroidia bacterium]|nr:class I SAM-dependent methyltransferase [Bacteroidia bacterium]
MEEKVSTFYDNYSKNQVKTGVHLRHYTLLQKLKKAGLQKDSVVLEVGCGIGTLTGLLGAYVKKGKIIAADISPESIEIAKIQNAKYQNIEYVVSDMMEFIPDKKLDFVVFPDVLEHIPKENHNRIFQNICKSIHPESKFAIHIPDPVNLDFIRKYQPDLLQIIDQSLYVEDLAKALEGTPLMVDIYERYALFSKNPDYNWIVLSVKKPLEQQHKKPKAIMKLVELYRRFNA